MRVALAQINTVVGDLDGNADKIRRRLAEAKDRQADLVVFPELAVTGYPPEDLLLRPSFVQAAQAKAAQIAREARGIVALLGVPWFERDLYNACAVCAAGEIKTIYRKRFLPNYGVFDEDRYFAPGRGLVLLEHGGTLFAPTICEDMWQPGPPATAARFRRCPSFTSARLASPANRSNPPSPPASTSSSRCAWRSSSDSATT